MRKQDEIDHSNDRLASSFFQAVHQNPIVCTSEHLVVRCNIFFNLWQLVDISPGEVGAPPTVLDTFFGHFVRAAANVGVLGEQIKSVAKEE